MPSTPKGRGLALAALLSAWACNGSTGPLPCEGACPCDTAADCQASQACVGGFCASVQPCASSADCADPTDVCVEGSCVPASVPDAGRADAGLDAGHPDSGVHDAGPDSGIADAGRDAGPDAGPDSGVDAGQPTDAGGCSDLTDCDGGLACVSGMCGACTDDSQCDPPALVCTAGLCVQGCLPGGCAAEQLCDSELTGLCIAAVGSGALGTACDFGTDCTTQGQSSAAGLCITVFDDGGAVCSSLCEATNQCPGGQVCATVGPVGVCLGEALVGATGEVGSNPVGASCTSFESCDSVAPASCGTFGTSATANVCTDTCAGLGVGCPSGWSCLTIDLFDPDAGSTCSSETTCLNSDPNSGCWLTSLGGDNRCHQEFVADECVDGNITTEGGSGATCTANSDCNSNWCVGGVCVAPCCTSNDCSASQLCTPVDGPSASILLGCVGGSGDLGLGETCDTTQPDLCRSGECVPNNPYLTAGQAGATDGYCSDTCCSDTQCGAGYSCALLASTLPDGGVAGLVPYCLKL